VTPTATAPSVPAVEGAIVFTDIVGFTEFTAAQGDEAALGLLAAQDRIVEEVIGGRGRRVKDLGDGLMLWFGDPCTAVRASLTLQDRFEERTAQDGLPLWVRIGVHYGRPVQRGADLIGHDVNIAARLVDLAAPGEVLVSAACVDPLRREAPDIRLEEIGPMVMKGIPEPVPVYRADWA
jgi:adenylate cyclase